MTFKKRLHSFLRFIYSVLSGILMFASIVLLICIFLAVLFNLNYDPSTLILLSIVFIGIISYIIFNKSVVIKTKKKNQSWFFFKEILKVGFVLFVFGLFITKLKLPAPVIEDKEEIEVETEEVVLYTDSTETSYEKYYESKQTWYDFQRNKHVLKFRVDFDSVQKSKANRESLEWRDFKTIVRTEKEGKYKPSSFNLVYSWGKLYTNLIENDRPMIENLASEFYEYQLKNELSRKQFAELMITAIQDIPYGLVLTDSCKVERVKPCIGNIKFGLFAPAEYVSNLHGDCDTRTVLLYTLLSRFNYDVAILSSKEYRHSMLGLNIPATGKYKTYKHKKYYFIETTGRGWSVGALPKDFSNINNWDVVLMHNTNI